MARIDPQSANDYDDRTTAAVKSVLLACRAWLEVIHVHES